MWSDVCVASPQLRCYILMMNNDHPLPKSFYFIILLLFKTKKEKTKRGHVLVYLNFTLTGWKLLSACLLFITSPIFAGLIQCLYAVSCSWRLFQLICYWKVSRGAGFEHWCLCFCRCWQRLLGPRYRHRQLERKWNLYILRDANTAWLIPLKSLPVFANTSF